MEITKTKIEDLLVLTPCVFKDDRGYFFESFSKKVFGQAGITAEFVQTNVSMSCKDVIRGLHFQKPPFAQGKLVSVLRGAVLDVAVDLRKSSPTYGQYHIEEISEYNKKVFWVPPGFAHGFRTLEDNTLFHYNCTAGYDKESEGSILWNDPDLAIDFGDVSPHLSEKDKVGTLFADFNSPF
ncbi:MAG: dTDP-4-dehydrorhamnose 3,5-epimerase [Bacteroidia bacterium]|jgi:dTDP-4-dehydrorhamnose 3,5-epimerase